LANHFDKHSSIPKKFSAKKIQAANNLCENLWDFAGQNFGRIPILLLAIEGFVYWFVLRK